MWLRYVDDTFVVIKNCEVERLHQSLNGVFPAIQFTRKEATEDILPFLDVSVQRLSDGNLATSVHRKDSSAEIILNYGSNHPAAHKKAVFELFFTALFGIVASIPLDLAKQYTEDLLKSCDTDVPAIALLELLDLCMETNFSFDQQYYKQLKGAPMGSPISGFLTEITMQKLETMALPSVNPKLWLRISLDPVVAVEVEEEDEREGKEEEEDGGGD
nr:unnamed protein product [Spirometra erinaceieuropaei]